MKMKFAIIPFIFIATTLFISSAVVNDISSPTFAQKSEGAHFLAELSDKYSVGSASTNATGNAIFTVSEGGNEMSYTVNTMRVNHITDVALVFSTNKKTKGAPASAKTLFLQAIIEISKGEGIYFDCTNTTNRILDVLEQERPKVICLDELEKMPRQFQEKLLNFLESGRVKVDQVRRQYDRDRTCQGFCHLQQYQSAIKALAVQIS